ncbi:hypothetical protein Btru_067539 [Bulinus truncatus]|nr:hypothetical protein Btru_067539 [Bulinus truncatus]
MGPGAGQCKLGQVSTFEMSRYNVSLFLPAPDDELLCGICMNVLDKPLETPCRHVFCTDCIHKAVMEQQKCPLCRKKCKKSMLKDVLPLVQNLINKLTMKCSNLKNGCLAPIKMEYYLDHLEKCDFAMIRCCYKECSVQMLRKELEEHEKNECFYRHRLCDKGCGLMLAKSEAEKHDCLTALVSLVKDLKEEKASMMKKLDDMETKLSVIHAEISAPLSDSDGSEIPSLSTEFGWITSEFDSDLVSSPSSSEISDFSEFDSNSNLSVEVHDNSEIVVNTTDETVDNELMHRNFDALPAVYNGDRLYPLEASIPTAEDPLSYKDLPTTSTSLDDSASPIVGYDKLNGTNNKRSQDDEVIKRIKRLKRTKPSLSVNVGLEAGPATPSTSTGCKKYTLRNLKSKTSNVDGKSDSVKTRESVQSHFQDLGVNEVHTNVQDSDFQSADNNASTLLEENRSSAGPLTRSVARLKNGHVNLSINVIPNVKVPPTAAYLLSKYTVDDSSEDESWSPSETD